jgi:hypothetical protein
MTRVEELELAVEALPEKEYHQFRSWFLERDWEKWDRQIEADVQAGKLDFLIEEALQSKGENQLSEL